MEHFAGLDVSVKDTNKPLFPLLISRMNGCERGLSAHIILRFFGCSRTPGAPWSRNSMPAASSTD